MTAICRNRCKRGADLTGRVVGPYVAVRPVGNDAASSIYYVLQCPICGYETSRHRNQFHSTAKVAGCGGCGAWIQQRELTSHIESPTLGIRQVFRRDSQKQVLVRALQSPRAMHWLG